MIRYNYGGLVLHITRAERLSLKMHPKLDEKWVQQLIADDPSILGLGDLVLKDKERNQPRAGRLDLLLQEPESKRRYEVEVQLGPTDENHIIRTIEYWDIERKRYPQYDHCAVIIAEDIVSRFLNVISLFNGNIPLIALQMQAYNVGEHTTLIFTKVVDENRRGLVDEDEEAEAAPADRAFWEARGSKATLGIVDEILEIAREIVPNLELKYNKVYIGFSRQGQVFNIARFKPRKSTVNMQIKLGKSDDIDSDIEKSGIDALEYNSRWGMYGLSIQKTDVVKNRVLIRKLMEIVYKNRAGVLE